MTLDSLQFSDLILMDDKAFLKGTPELGQQMQLITPEMVHPNELRELIDTVENSFSSHRDGVENIRIGFGKLSFRVANFSGVDGRAYFLRRLAEKVPTMQELGFDKGLCDWLLHKDRQKGLVLFCGSQASGKTTSAAAFIASRLALYGGHAVSWENPVEMPLAGPHGEYGYAFQTQVRSEAELAAHIERSHRFSSPNIVYVGEIRSKHAASEVLRVSLGSANQIVVSTIHGMGIITALERLMTWAAELDSDVASQNLAHSLLAIVYQELQTENDTTIMKTPETLLVPFSSFSRSLRSKIRDGRLASLAEEITLQRNKVKFQGMGAIS
ncbi:MAG: ATPase, T2SS/T4P/T4SS family [Pseudomonadota bacterium]